MRLASLLPIAALATCAPPQSDASSDAVDRTAIEAEIETAVRRMLNEVTPSQYARTYALQANGHIRALYTRECGKDWATCAEAKVTWVEPEMLPPGPMDGGCGVVHVEYDPANHALVTAVCNGEA